MVRGGRSGRVSTSVGRGSASPDRLPVHADCPSNRDRLPDPANSVTFPIPITTRGKIDPGSASRYITTLVHAHIPRPVDSWKEFPPSVRELLFDMFRCRKLTNFISKQWRYVFTRPEDLPRARVVWESTAQTNLRKSMWEARDKATKTTCSLDPTAWMDYIPRHKLKRAPTFRELFDRNHKRKGTDDYVSESARTIVETYDRTMADRYAEGTPHPDLDLEAWVDTAGGLRKGRVYGFGDILDTTLVLSSYASSVAPPAYASSSAAPPDNGGEDMRTLIRDELQTQFGVMVK
ncbi:hypothetical protein Taro_038204 [Colocasia esculenta]|uniref:Uncharacterized protein n=1 Tax=Colocasia esculenta TaxID=4460 RepID=A0A843W2S0_COLES|nr:hypothetical protein [Colocasia esculenta]